MLLPRGTLRFSIILKIIHALIHIQTRERFCDPAQTSGHVFKRSQLVVLDLTEFVSHRFISRHSILQRLKASHQRVYQRARLGGSCCTKRNQFLSGISFFHTRDARFSSRSWVGRRLICSTEISGRIIPVAIMPGSTANPAGNKFCRKLCILWK